MNVTIPELADWLKGFDDIAVFGHRAPDGDACGSCVAVTLALRALGKRACACLSGGHAGISALSAGAGTAWWRTETCRSRPSARWPWT